ncbi:MAG: helix-turn-helix domain-containing protein [Trichodesmium sp. MO_231.B1]|nr:helix-turn-helix domain-containing protein [Trichodesmium sp. MO_231.B1]
MLLGFKTELHPNNQQKTLLAKHAGVARRQRECLSANTAILAANEI